MLEVLRTDLGSLHCHVWETYHKIFPFRYIPYGNEEKVMMLRQLSCVQLVKIQVDVGLLFSR